MLRRIPNPSYALAIAVCSWLVSSEAVTSETKSHRELGAEAAASWGEMEFSDFEATVFKEPFEGGMYIVDGHVPIADRGALRAYFDARVRESRTIGQVQRPELAIFFAGGNAVRWSKRIKRSLTYCVSDEFGSRQLQVIDSFATAARKWSSVADIAFHHDYTQDRFCYSSNDRIVFDIRPVDVGDAYLARSFYPNDPRSRRSLLVNSTVWADHPMTPSLTDVLTHEIGHILGFRHEHVRPEATACWEDENWDGVTDFDGRSIMHHPQCTKVSVWNFTLSELDKHGAACVYGEANGFSVDNTIVDVQKCGEFIARRQPFEEYIMLESGDERSFELPVLPISRAIVEIDASRPKDVLLLVNYNFKASDTDHICRADGRLGVSLCDVSSSRDQYSLHFTVRAIETAEVRVTALYVN